MYEIHEEVGKGTYSRVHRVTEKATGQMMALKIIDIAASGEEIYDLQHEITVQMGCNSTHICKYHKSFIRGNELWVLLEFLGGGSLTELMKSGPFPENDIRVIIRQIVRGLLYMHCRGIVHRDVKRTFPLSPFPSLLPVRPPFSPSPADNVRISESGDVKLADFRVSATVAQMHSTFAGTPFYIAPEIILEKIYSQKVDIWSVGITCIELAKGRPPNHELEPIQALNLIRDGPVPQLEGEFSDTFKEFVAFCHNKDPNLVSASSGPPFWKK